MDQLNEKTFKDLNQRLLDISEKFFLAKKVKENPDVLILAESPFDENYSLDEFISKVQQAYETLDDNEKNLINNEFFYQSYQEWWKPLFSKASFYRYKKLAMEKFLGAFYDL